MRCIQTSASFRNAQNRQRPTAPSCGLATTRVMASQSLRRETTASLLFASETCHPSPCRFRLPVPYPFFSSLCGHSAILTLDTSGRSSGPSSVTRISLYPNPGVVAGDFNSNTIWDYKRPAGQNHSGLVRQLASLGLVSAYHHFFREAHGAESQPTLYLQRIH